MASAKGSVQGTVPKTYNKGGSARANSGKRQTEKTSLGKRALNKAKKFGNALVKGKTGRVSKMTSQRPGR